MTPGIAALIGLISLFALLVLATSDKHGDHL
jgi:hypothetical protein